MRTLTKIDRGWEFFADFADLLIKQKQAGEAVRLPHNAVDLEMNYFDERCYQKEFAYQYVLAWRPEFKGQEVALVFDGAMANSTVWINGHEVAHHADGYTPFEARLTGWLREGDNLVTVRIDGSENPDIPPFGGQIDYLTYAGLYREVALRVTAPHWIENVKVETPDPLAPAKSVRARVILGGAGGGAEVEARLLDAAGGEVARATAPAAEDTAEIAFDSCSGVSCWFSPSVSRMTCRCVSDGTVSKSWALASNHVPIAVPPSA